MFKRKSIILISMVLCVFCILVLTVPAKADDSPLSFSKFCHQYLSSMTKQHGMAHVKVTTEIVKATSDKYSVTVTMAEDSAEKSITVQSITGYLFDGNEATGKFALPAGITINAGQEVLLDTFAFSAPDDYWIGLEVSCSDGQTFWYIRQLPAESDKVIVPDSKTEVETMNEKEDQMNDNGSQIADDGES